MQEENKKDVPMVDLDVSGEGAEIELEEQKPENEVETKEEDSSPAPQVEETREEKAEGSDAQPEAEKKQEEKPEQKKEELETYSKDVQRRISKLTKKWREAQRQADEALEFARSQKRQKEDLQKRYSTIEEAGVKHREESIKSGLQAAAAKLAAARESGDLTAEVEASKEIARLGSEENDLIRIKAAAESMPEAKSEEIPKVTPQQTAQPDPKAEAWGARNKWFGTDTAMTYTAFDLHKKLVDEEGFDPKSDDYYAEIDKRIRLEFPQKFVNTEDKVQQDTTKPTQIVASAKRSVNKSGRKTVRLTPSQVAIAKKLGVPLEEYAKQMKITKEV